MTPGGRAAAAMELIGEILAGAPADRALIRWTRGNRYAGSKDRNAIRDILFDCLRRRRSFGYRMGADTGRALVIARLLHEGSDPSETFTGEGFAPHSLTRRELDALAAVRAPAPRPVALDYPDFLDVELTASLGRDLEAVMSSMQERAPVYLRVNTLRGTTGGAQVMLAQEGIQSVPLPQSATALQVTGSPRRVANSRAYRTGLVELQDISSQAVAAYCGAAPGMTVLDYCAGGGGKTLALAAAMENRGRLVAHDANAARMTDLPQRARRAGAGVEIAAPDQLGSCVGKCDIVLVDAPCTGSGAWRRKPDSKWRLSEEMMAGLIRLQAEIMLAAADYVRPGGLLVYATCSLFSSENERQTERFLSRGNAFALLEERRWTPLEGGDGFYAARLRKTTGD